MQPTTRRPLVNAVERHEQFPKTFAIPTSASILALKPGDYVKVIAEFPAQGPIEAERFWVEVVENRDGHIVGVVNNNLLYTDQHGYADGQDVEVEPHQVAATGRITAAGFVNVEGDCNAPYQS